VEPGFHVAETAVAVIDDASVTKAFRAKPRIRSMKSAALIRAYWRAILSVADGEARALHQLLSELGRRNAGRRARMPSAVRSVTASPAAVAQFQHVWVFLEPFRSRPAHIVHLGTIVIGERFCDLVPQIRNSGAERADPFDEHGHDGHRDVVPANMVSAA
jgi:hypothetical protein